MDVFIHISIDAPLSWYFDYIVNKCIVYKCLYSDAILPWYPNYILHRCILLWTSILWLWNRCMWLWAGVLWTGVPICIDIDVILCFDVL